MPDTSGKHCALLPYILKYEPGCVKVQFVCCAAGNHSGSGFAPPRLLRTTTGLTAKPYFAQHYSADDVTTSRSTAKAKCLCRLCARAPVDLVTSTPERQPGNRPPPTTASSTQVSHANPEVTPSSEHA
ncbi:hypothetical protein Bbelb_163910 [Branchiostoma belcheri]|nr:hypothetical protein Bbelb_163910 [Branchiostoma belcheri]